MQASNSIFTDGYITQTLLGVIAFLITLAMGLIIYIWNQREKEYKLALVEEEAYRKSLDQKFEGINTFILIQNGINKGVEKDQEHNERRIDALEKHPKLRHT